MTVKVKNHHYNVKFLKGYGHSIKVKNAKIILTNNSDPFSKPEKEEWYADNMPYEKIVLSGKGYISTEARFAFSKQQKCNFTEFIWKTNNVSKSCKRVTDCN